MKSIPQNHQANRWNYTLVQRNEAAAIYAQHLKPILHDMSKASAYEVVLIRFQKPCNTGKFFFEGGECLPSTEHWGLRAWTCHTLDRARQKFAEVSTPSRIASAVKALAGLQITQ